MARKKFINSGTTWTEFRNSSHYYWVIKWYACCQNIFVRCLSILEPLYVNTDLLKFIQENGIYSWICSYYSEHVEINISCDRIDPFLKNFEIITLEPASCMMYSVFVQCVAAFGSVWSWTVFELCERVGWSLVCRKATLHSSTCARESFNIIRALLTSDGRAQSTAATSVPFGLRRMKPNATRFITVSVPQWALLQIPSGKEHEVEEEM